MSFEAPHFLFDLVRKDESNGRTCKATWVKVSYFRVTENARLNVCDQEDAMLTEC